LFLFSSPKGSENNETKISELGKYISYCTLSHAIAITYHILNKVRQNLILGIFIEYILKGNIYSVNVSSVDAAKLLLNLLMNALKRMNE